MKLLIGYYNKSVIITYIGVCAAVCGIALSFSGSMKPAALCMVICGVCDLFDGAFARRCKRTDAEKEFGVQIDSLADMISFAALPVAFGAGLGQTSPIHIALYAVYVLAAVTRLGYFNVSVSGAEGETGFYRGLPTTFSSLIFTLVWVIASAVGGNAAAVLYPAAIAVTAVLFVLNIRIPKPRGAAYGLLALVAAAMTVCIFIFGA